VANALVDGGDTVQVYAPPIGRDELSERSIQVHRLPGHFDPRSLYVLNRALRDHRDDLVLVQYVPHAYGYKAMNLPFCLWLNALRRTHRRIIVMFHEVSMPFRRAQPMSHRLQAVVTSPMAMLVARAASDIFVSIPAWKDRLIRFGVRKPIAWLPVPSNIPVVDDQAAITALRRSLRAEMVVGHFGTCGGAIADALRFTMGRLLSAFPGMTFMLIGRDGGAMKEGITGARPQLAERIHATGGQPDRDVSIALSACELMIQPYEDGVSSRRTGVMAALAHRRPVVTTVGESTEPIWAETGAAVLVPGGANEALCDALRRLMDDWHERDRIALAGKRLYDERFDVRHTVMALRKTACA
jgi:glycosyltransferase involved in cell wall biosynthesis